MGQTNQVRKLIKRLRVLNATGRCYVSHEQRFTEVPGPWWLWHVAYRQLSPLKLDGRLTRVASLSAGFSLTVTDVGLAIHNELVAAPGVSIPSSYWLMLPKLLRYNPTGQYTTLDDIRQAIAEEAWPEQATVIERRRGVLC